MLKYIDTDQFVKWIATGERFFIFPKENYAREGVCWWGNLGIKINKGECISIKGSKNSNNMFFIYVKTKDLIHVLVQSIN